MCCIKLVLAEVPTTKWGRYQKSWWYQKICWIKHPFWFLMKICSIIFYIKNVSTLRHRSKKFFKIMVSEVPISRKSFLFCCLYTFWHLQLFGYMPYLRAVLYSSRTDLNFKTGQNTCFNISKCTCFLLGFDFSTSSVAAPGGLSLKY